MRCGGARGVVGRCWRRQGCGSGGRGVGGATGRSWWRSSPGVKPPTPPLGEEEEAGAMVGGLFFIFLTFFFDGGSGRLGVRGL